MLTFDHFLLENYAFFGDSQQNTQYFKAFFVHRVFAHLKYIVSIYMFAFMFVGLKFYPIL